jgi:hypothetical protein
VEGSHSLFSTSSRLVPGPTQPAVQWVQGGGRHYFSGSKAARGEADYSPPTRAYIKNMSIFTFTPPPLRPSGAVLT